MQQNQPLCKIYSRKRIKIFKPRKYRLNNKYEDKSKFFYFLIIIMIALMICLIIYNSIDPIFENLALTEAKAIATKITNEESTRAIVGYTYEDLFTIEKDSEGNIQMINANILKMNLLTSDIASFIQNSLDNTDSSKIKLSIGSLTGIKMLSGIGPNMSLKISSAGDVETDLRSEFVSQGINQTLHRIYLQINSRVTILTPIKTLQEEISNQVLLAEHVIIGQIPSTYYNFDNMEPEQSLEMIK